jgi:hypothetical protein
MHSRHSKDGDSIFRYWSEESRHVEKHVAACHHYRPGRKADKRSFQRCDEELERTR